MKPALRTALFPFTLFAVLIGCRQQRTPDESHATQPAKNPRAAPAPAQIADTPSGTVMTPEYEITEGKWTPPVVKAAH
jgi:hypothetical protein